MDMQMLLHRGISVPGSAYSGAKATNSAISLAFPEALAFLLPAIAASA
jgi:hypothetical protein